MQSASVERFHGAERHPRLASTYGPTEASISVTACETEQHMQGGKLRYESPLGHAIDNCRVLALDDRLTPIPVGVVGEICIGGFALARGYVGDPSQTAQLFVPDPFSSGTRLYRTGDRGRWQTDGSLEFVGRKDDQVKIRGFRIEPAEIEATLQRHPSVAEAVTAVHDAGRGERHLVAYVRLKSPADGVELRAFTAKQLPSYMVPSAFIFIDHWPLTSHGKIDRKALPAAHMPLSRQYVAPRNTFEQTVADLWAEVLGVSHVGVHDNFFELGGHSLLATQLVSRVRHRIQVELPVRAIFEAPTVEELADCILEIQLATLNQTPSKASAR
jgi:acyl-coenzyme A synthetase/AMP-(fatty) acid ligase/acyl carrier protein